MAFPDAVALEYARELKAIAAVVSRELRSAYMPALASLLTRTDGLRLDAADDIKKLSRRARNASTKVTEDAATLAARTLRRTDTFVQNQLRAQSTSRLGVNVFTAEPDLRATLNSFVEENVQLIQSLATDQIGEVEGIARDAVERGRRHETVAKELTERFDISERRAALIARDQIGTANAQLTQARQEAAGVDKYTWQTSDDERVRGNPSGLYPKSDPSHYLLNEQVFSWDDPPESGVDGEHQHPGEPISCRCSAIPYLDDIYANLAAGGSL
jgi:SPP1 gp7 family putative phage head morphogenesis protein